MGSAPVHRTVKMHDRCIILDVLGITIVYLRCSVVVVVWLVCLICVVCVCFEIDLFRTFLYIIRIIIGFLIHAFTVKIVYPI